MNTKHYKYGYLSILFFVIYFVFIQLDKNLLINIIPVFKIVLSIILILLGIITGYLGIKRNIQKTMSIIGVILNGLSLVSYSIGLFSSFL